MRKLCLGILVALLVAIISGGAAQDQDRFTVYADYDSPDNHFFYKAAFFSEGGLAYMPVMDEQWADNVHGGGTAIQCQLDLRDNNWGAWYFQNGVLSEETGELVENWGTHPNAGIDLTGYNKLTFWARGAKGGEAVEFFCLGIGRDSNTGAAMAGCPYPGSNPKMSGGYVKLGTEWKQYVIDLKGCNLSYVLGGFGWASSAAKNGKKSNVTFYLDDIYFEK
jgi:hypothetical protein